MESDTPRGRHARCSTWRRRELLAQALHLPLWASGGVGMGIGMTLAVPAVGAASPQAPQAPRPQVDVGRFERWERMTSRHVAARPVDIWLPDVDGDNRPHSVLWMHDGQMLYDGRTTWNGQAWHVHRAVHDLMKSGQIGPTVVVGVWNNGPERYAEYFPQKALALARPADRQGYLSHEANGQAKADAYLRFLVEELRPALAARVRIRHDAAGHLVAGASMGGLISLYALCEHPTLFGAAAGLSTHWVGVAPSRSPEDLRQEGLSLAFLDYLQRHLPAAGQHRLWVDRGDDALDRLYAPGLERFERLARERGYTDSDAVVRTVHGTGHNETDWSRRIAEVVAFLARR